MRSLILLALVCATPVASQTSFTIQLPVRSADAGASLMSLNPFGAHIGNHGIDGHPGWDIEYQTGASVYAAADGVVQSAVVNTDGTGAVQIQHTQRFRTNYVGLATLDPAMVPGAPVKAGQRVGTPQVNTQMVGTVMKTWAAIHFQVDDFTVNRGLTNGFAVSPEAHLNAAGRAVFDELWSRAAYSMEVCEPFPSNSRATQFPLTRTWTRQAGALAARVDFTCLGALSSGYAYSFYDASGAVIERGSVEPQSYGPEWTSIDLSPEGGGQRRRALLRILNDSMLLDYSAPGGQRPAGLDAATRFRTPGFPLAIASGASYAAGLVAPDSVAAAFADGLAVQSATAPGGAALPTTLAGTRAMVRDSAGVERDAGLYFVTTGQVGLLIPAATAAGPAEVLITSPDGPVFTVDVQVAAVAPGLFSADSSGSGLAAASIQRVRPGGAQSVEPVARYDTAAAQWVAVPVEFDADDLYLVLYGTGIRQRTSLTQVTVRIGSLVLPVAFAGGQGAYAGLDQVNVSLPRSLAGSGRVDIALFVDGKASNAVTVTLR